MTKSTRYQSTVKVTTTAVYISALSYLSPLLCFLIYQKDNCSNVFLYPLSRRSLASSNAFITAPSFRYEPHMFDGSMTTEQSLSSQTI